MQKAGRYSRRIAASLQQSQHHFERKLEHVFLDIDRLPAAFLGIASQTGISGASPEMSSSTGVESRILSSGYCGNPRPSWLSEVHNGRNESTWKEKIRQRFKYSGNTAPTPEPLCGSRHCTLEELAVRSR